MRKDKLPEDAIRCPACGYILYHVNIGACAECGEPIDVDLILHACEKTISCKTRDLQNAALTITIGVLTLPIVYVLVFFFPLVVLPVIPILYGVFTLLGVCLWRMNPGSAYVLATAHNVKVREFRFWFRSTILTCLLGFGVGPAWLYVFWNYLMQ